jgi:PAS domain S-box-containing protein
VEPPNDVNRKSRIDYERFFELAVDVFVVTGPNGRFERVNRALARLLGVEREVILANLWSEFVHPDDRERSAAESAREFKLGHRTITFENRYVDAAGAIHWMDWNADLDSETGLVYGIARDVTEQKAARDALEEARAAAEEARAAAETANMAKSEFLSRMSHELRTPLNAVLGFAQILELDGLNGLQKESVDQILRGGRHLLGLIDEILDISRIEIGEVSVSTETVRVADVVAEAMSLLGPLATAREVALRSTLADTDAGHVMADRLRLKQVLVNYVSNAIKYTPPGSTATISVSPAGDGWRRIAVSDDGPGIPEEGLGRLFNPFERIGAEHTDVEGTGLGLAHSKALTERMGGRVGVESTVGRGSVFWVELPIAQPPEDVEPDGLADVTPVSQGQTVGSLLYIEDNPSNLRLVQQILARRPGVRLLSAMLGRLGLELAREHQPDLIALDLHLPDISGETVLTQLRADPLTRDIPVVILSADATRRQIDHLFAVGAQAYLTKPLNVRAFLAVVDEHLGEPGSIAAT